MHWIEGFLATYGLIVVYFGVIIEGDSVLIAAGFLAHQGVMDPYGVFLAAFAGSLTSDQLLYYLGRYFADTRLVKKQVERPAFAKVLELIKTHRVLFILGFRFTYGVRTISPIAIGIAGVPAGLYTVLNVSAAIVWAALITGIGYLFGQLIERYAGRLHGIETKVVIALAIGLAVVAAGHLGRRWFMRRQASLGTTGSIDKSG
ncbi:DedA family protein [Kaistia dalseonensis]|uniref:Membrane protein DedA with SNARE-associated domain n=1 Tax=Kaistia dalseonensis TaxID=410840 RepID=A0ABU0H6Q8_9HYPH|nr:DedA family protein [Kaistia dalseonensis]MCX5494982.1 DedA family protein [Kaistia dalseonensis]MDQ0437563.1 membrane protein DedA with SNARE-associated domain [Kaistia dalseonensis]